MDEFRLKYEHERATASELGQQVLNLEKQLQQAKAIIQDLQNVPVSPEDEFDAGFTISTWNQQIKDYVAKAPSGSLMTLKEIIPQHDWVKVPEGRRKVLGKQFKQIVDNGGFDGITAIAEKTSSNEQLYIKST